MKQKTKNWFSPLLLLTLAAFTLRIYGIETNPPALNWDEVSHGYNAFSLLKTGKDEWGVWFPMIFRAFGDYKLPLYIYLTTIPVALLGLNPLSVRLISIIAGTLAIPGIYLLVSQVAPKQALKIKVFKRDLVFSYSLLAAFFLTLLPWHFFISRPALEANLSLTITIYLLYCLLRSLKSNQYYLHAAILAALSLHAYNTSRVFVPLVILVFFALYRPKIKLSKNIFIAIAILSSSVLLVISQVFTGTGTARYQKLAILTDQAVYQIGESRASSNLSPLMARLRFNRPVYLAQQFTKNYLSYFSPQFLYQSTGTQKQFAIPFKNLFTLNLTILAIVGIIFTIKNKHEKNNKLLLSLLLLAPIAAALTTSPPQALRPNPMIISMVIFATYGFVFVVRLFSLRDWAKTTVAAILVISFIASSVKYMNAYWGSYRANNSTSWQYGYQQAMDYVDKHATEYDRVFVTKYHGEPHIFYAFFTSLDPALLQPNDDNIRFQQSDWFWTDKIGDVYFVNDWDIPKFVTADTLTLESKHTIPTNNSLLITSVNSLPSNTEIIELIDDLAGNVAFVIARFK